MNTTGILDCSTNSIVCYAHCSELCAGQARLLLLAPALRNVVLDPRPADRWLAAALGRSRCVVTGHLHVRESVWRLPDSTAALDLLWRSRHHLRGLSVRINHYSQFELDSECRSALHVVGGLRRLQVLQLDWLDERPYAGELRGGLPALRRLTVSAMHPEEPFCFVDEAPAALLADLLRGAAASLRHFQHDSFEAVPAAVLHCLAECAELREVVANGSVVAAAHGWPRIRGLRLMFAVRSANGVACFAGAVSACESLPSLRRLHLGVFHDGRGRSGAARDKAACGSAVAAFRAARPDVHISFSQT